MEHHHCQRLYMFRSRVHRKGKAAHKDFPFQFCKPRDLRWKHRIILNILIVAKWLCTVFLILENIILRRSMCCYLCIQFLRQYGLHSHRVHHTPRMVIYMYYLHKKTCFLNKWRLSKIILQFRFCHFWKITKNHNTN